MLILQIGIFMLLIVILNWVAMIYEVFKHVPRDNDISKDNIFENFIKNMDLKTMELLRQYVYMNKFLSVGAFLFITYALII
jgi:hypothetical protein